MGALVAEVELILIILWEDSVHIFVVATRYPKGEHILEGAIILVGVDNQRA
jgi:hypothetical protein